MNGSIQNMQLSTILFICIFFFSACTSFPLRISEKSKGFRSSSEAESIISILKNQNHDLKTIKGMGRITFLESQEKEMTTRIAWVASTPDKIRISLSSVSGHPMISAASDGQWFYFFSHASGDFYKKRPTNFNMKRFFSVSVKSEDIVDMLFGRIPLAEYDSMVFMEDRSSRGRSGNFESAEASSFNKDIKGNKNGSVIILKNKWGNVREKIYLNDKEDVYKIEMFDLSGALLYRLILIKMQDVKSYRVPYRLKVSNNDGAGFKLDLNRYWADADVSPSVFTLTPPKQN
jgi:outer membrane lipoprotein-sorting protein